MEKLNVEITLQKVQKWVFWADSRTSIAVEKEYFVFDVDEDWDYIESCLRDWTDEFSWQYSYIHAQSDMVGEPYIQKRIKIPVIELHRFFELTDAERIMALWFDSDIEARKDVTFIIGVNEPNEDFSS